MGLAEKERWLENLLRTRRKIARKKRTKNQIEAVSLIRASVTRIKNTL